MGIIMKDGIQCKTIFTKNLKNSNIGIIFKDGIQYRYYSTNKIINPDPVDGTYLPGTGTTYTLCLNFSTGNANTWGTWIDSNLTECSPGGGENEVDTLMGYYPCTLNEKGEEIEKINPNDYTKNINGVSLSNSDKVMVKFPCRGYKIWWDSNNTNKLYVSITNERDREDYEYVTYEGKNLNAFYLGAYEGNISSNKLLSKTNLSPTVNQTISTFRTAAQANGKGFELFSFKALTYLQCCALIKYKGKSIQTALGYGVYNASSKINSGNCNTVGLNFASTQYGNKGAKLFGIENLWGNIFTWIDGVCTNSNYHVLVGDGNFNNTGTGYTDVGTTSYGTGWVSRVKATSTKMGFVPSSFGGSASTYFCDYAAIRTSSVAIIGGNWDGGDKNGLFYFCISDPGSHHAAYIGGRLMYYKTKEE